MQPHDARSYDGDEAVHPHQLLEGFLLSVEAEETASKGLVLHSFLDQSWIVHVEDGRDFLFLHVGTSILSCRSKNTRKYACVS